MQRAGGALHDRQSRRPRAQPEEIIMEHHDIIIPLFVFAAYLFPAIVAALRRHKNQNAIAVLNFLTGWTVLGWVVAIVWACTDNVRSRPQR
jgi:hypothetical protein